MKKIIISIFLSLVTLTAYSQERKAIVFAEQLKEIASTKLVYKGHALAFGFNTIDSCLFTGKDLVILKNYCYPAKKYPAQGYTIVSKKFGVTEIYEEDLGPVLKKDIRIETFDMDYAPYSATDLKTVTIKKLNGIFEDIYNRRVPQCWSTSYSQYTETKDVGCTKGLDSSNTMGLAEWYVETQNIVNDEKYWNELLAKLSKATAR